MTMHKLEKRLRAMVDPLTKQLVTMTEDLERWRARAKKAERQLKQVRRALGINTQPAHVINLRSRAKKTRLRVVKPINRGLVLWHKKQGHKVKPELLAKVNGHGH